MSAKEIYERFLKKTDSPGRGKKQCPDCEMYVGIRTLTCTCGYVFGKSKNKDKKAEEIDVPSDEDKLYAACIGANGGRFVYRASGSPSITLQDLSIESVFDYCNLVTNEGITQNKIYTVSAIKGFLQHQFGYNSGEYMSASVMVDKWYNEMLGVDIPSGN